MRGSYYRQDRPFPEAYRRPGTMARLATLREVVDELDARPGQVMLSGLVQSTPSMRPIVGVRYLEQLDAALAIPRLSPEQMDRLDAVR